MSVTIDGWKCWTNGRARIAQRHTHRIQAYAGYLRACLTRTSITSNIPLSVVRWLLETEKP
jgi:hypothetical protein